MGTTDSNHLAPLEVPINRVLVIKSLPGKAKQGWTAYYSDDFFVSIQTMFEGAVRLALTHSFVYVAKPDIEKGGIGLYVAENSKASYTFKKVELPFELLREHSYTLVEVESRHIYMHVSHSRDELYYGNLFVSDYFGRKFELSLKHNVRSSSGVADFRRIEGVLGVYVANTFTETAITNFEGRLMKGKARNASRVHVDESIAQESKITFDDGKNWNALNLKGEGCGQAGKECRLHLHSLTSHRLGLLSQASVPGVIIGHGNAGSSLSSQIASYISLDSGASWRLLMTGRRLIAMSKYAGIIVTVMDSEPTSELLFSVDYGSSWSQLAFSRTPVLVTRIVVEGGSDGTQFVITGVVGRESGFSVAVGFRRGLKRACNGEQEFDYEEWSLSHLAKK